MRNMLDLEVWLPKHNDIFNNNNKSIEFATISGKDHAGMEIPVPCFTCRISHRQPATPVWEWLVALFDKEQPPAIPKELLVSLLRILVQMLMHRYLSNNFSVSHVRRQLLRHHMKLAVPNQ
jgi:hypothetical protein